MLVAAQSLIHPTHLPSDAASEQLSSGSRARVWERAKANLFIATI